MTTPIRAALERLVAAVKPKYTDPEDIVEVASAVLAARAALKTEPEGEGPAAWLYKGNPDFDGTTWRDNWCVTTDKQVALFKAEPGCPVPLFRHPATPTAPPAPETPAEALAARPLLEQVAAMSDCIGAQTVGQITAISNRAAAWLRQNPPSQPVAIEPRGCPTPGACSCVESAPPAPEPQSPSGYAYRYSHFAGGTYIKFNGGGEVNGSRPIEAVPYWFAPPSVPTTPSTPEPGEVGELVELLKLAGRWATSTGVQLDRFAALFDHQEAELAALRGRCWWVRLRIAKAGIRAGYNLGHYHTVESGWGDPDEVADDFAQDTLDNLDPLPAPQEGEGEGL